MRLVSAFAGGSSHVAPGCSFTVQMATSLPSAEAHDFGGGRTAHWTVRSELTEVVLVPTCGWLAGCAYLGHSLSTFDAVWRLVESGAIRDMPVEHDVWW
jgi:hypothetical protein